MVVAEILADFLQDDSAESLEHTAPGDCFGEVTCLSFHMVSMWAISHNARKRGEGGGGRTRRLQHAAYCPRNTSGAAGENELEAVAGDESHVSFW